MRYVKLILAFIAVLFCGCYTRLISKPLKNPGEVWRDEHDWQYYAEAEWGKEWNSYYWHPRWTDKKVYPTPASSKKSRKKEKYEKYEDYDDEGTRRRKKSQTCEDRCCGCCLLPFCESVVYVISPRHKHDDDHEYLPDTTARPQRRRGLQ